LNAGRNQSINTSIFGLLLFTLITFIDLMQKRLKNILQNFCFQNSFCNLFFGINLTT
jgi:hypothetical protein